MRCSSAPTLRPPAAAKAWLVDETTRLRSSSRVPFQSQTRCVRATADNLQAWLTRLSSQIPQQAGLLDAPVSVLRAVEQQHRHAVAVVAFELDRGVHVDPPPPAGGDPVE